MAMPTAAQQGRIMDLVASPLQANRFQDAAYVKTANTAFAQKQARIADYNAYAKTQGIAPYGVYRRFDYKKPGEALRQFGFTPARAAGIADRALTFQRPAGTAAENAVAVAMGNAPLPQARQQVDSITNDIYRARENASRREFLRANGITLQSSPEAKANALDSYWRYLQFKNQLPPRGIIGSLPFTIATTLLGGAFGLPALQAGLLRGIGAGALIPAIGTAETIGTAYNVGKGISNPSKRGP